jgi:hypothetical protein
MRVEVSGPGATPAGGLETSLVLGNTPPALLGADTRDPAAIPHWDGLRSNKDRLAARQDSQRVSAFHAAAQ